MNGLLAITRRTRRVLGEPDVIYGSFIRVAARHGVPTPMSQMVHALLAAGDAAIG